ncbi:MAG: hypothetical protein NT154_21085 [Verrucomicrobia bacterium]|nr:hypothetical protein [Verrucomicrobiota bacterium]
MSCAGVNFQNSGNVTPGAATGTLTFVGTYNQTAVGQLNIEIGGLTAGSQYDRLAVSGNANLDGWLNVGLINDFMPAVSNSFRVLTCASLSGQFASYSGLVYYTNGAFSPSYLVNALDLTARSVSNAVIEAPRIIVQPQSLSLIQGQTATFRMTANGTQPFAYQWLHNNSALAAATNATLILSDVQTNHAGLYAVRVTNAAGAALSSSALLTVRQVTDLIVTDVSATNDAVAGQPLVVTWSSINAGSAPAIGPWAETVALSSNASGTNPRLLATYNFTNSLVPGQSLRCTHSVIVPAGLEGQYFVLVNIDTDNVIPEDIFETNNACVSTQFVTIRAPDLIVESFSSPPSAQFGQTLQAVWTVKNRGSADVAGPWNDRLYLSSVSNSVQGARVILTLPSVQPLGVGESYARTQAVVLPLSATLNPGDYFVVPAADCDGSVPESIEANNLGSSALALTLPPLPDLVVGSVSSPAQGLPGQVIPVAWSVTNVGPADAFGSWRESVYLTNAAVGGTPALLLGSFLFTNNLAPNETVIRTQPVTLPISGPAGDLRVVVLVDSEGSLFEQSEANNTALATNALQVPLMLSLAFPATNMLENTSTPNLSCLVSRNGDLGAPALVTLVGSAPSHLLVPLSVTIPAGAAGAPFTATVLHDGMPGPDVWAAITAQAGGFLGATSAVFVVNTDLPRLSLSLAAPETLQGQTVVAAVSREPTGEQPVTVMITSSDPGRLAAPSTVTIPSNCPSVTFNLLAVDNTAIEPPQLYTVTATASGYVGASTNLAVINIHIPTLALTLDRTNVSEGDGPAAVVGTVTRQPIGDQSLTIALNSTNPAAALVPAQVTIPAMQGEASFFVAAVANSAVTGPKATWISAQALDTSGNPVGSQAGQELMVQDDDGPTLKVLIAQKVVGKGLDQATTAAVWRNTPPTNDLVVVLATSATNAARVPPTVTIPTGQTNSTFTIASLDGGATHTSQTVIITASATNFTSGSDQLVVTDFSLPDLVISSITVPASVYVGDPVTVTFRLANQGLGPLTNGVSQSVYLAPDSAAGSVSRVGTLFFGGPLAAGQHLDQTVSIPGSAFASPGTFRIWVTAVAEGSAIEINKANNTTVSEIPIVVSAEYTASVKAGVTNVTTGTPVPLSGSATLAAGGPAASKPVNILVSVRGFQRVLSALTDTNGLFSTVFTPLPGEAGIYSVAAVSPGVAQAPAQDQFTIVGMTLDPSSLSWGVIDGGSVNGAATIRNLGEVPLTDLSATANGLAPNLTAHFTLSTNRLAGQGSVTLACSMSAHDATVRQSAFTVHLASAEGAMFDLPVNVTVMPLLPQLSAVPAQLSAAMLRGAQTIVQFDVVNLGGAASGPLTVNIPSASWLSVASPNPLASLEPGATNRVTLLLTPAADLPLGPYNGSLVLSSPGASATIGFQFLNISDLKGHLRVTAVDEYTYYAEGAPRVTNATIRIVDATSGALVVTTNTGTSGAILLNNLTEAYYVVEVSADEHGSFRDTFFLQAGRTNELTAFMPRQTVKYYWTVEPTQIGDRARISIETVFETVVPVPVVTIEPNVIDLASVGVSTQINLNPN